MQRSGMGWPPHAQRCCLGTLALTQPTPVACVATSARSYDTMRTMEESILSVPWHVSFMLCSVRAGSPALQVVLLACRACMFPCSLPPTVPLLLPCAALISASACPPAAGRHL